MSWHGLMKYPVAESTGIAHEGIDSIIAENQIDAQNEQYKLHGAVGPNPAYDEEGNIRIDEGWAPDIALAPFMTGKSLLKYASGVKPFVKKIMKDPKELKRMTNRGYTRAKLAATDAIKKSKPYQQARDKFQKWNQPELLETDPIMQAAGRSGRHAIDDIAGKRGLDRFFHTIGATKSPMNNPRVRAAMEETIGSRILQADIKAVPKNYNFLEMLKGSRGQRIGGRAMQWDTGPARVEFGRSKDIGWLDSVGKHEFTHLAQLQGPRNAKWMDHMAKKHKLTGDEMTWMQSRIYDRPSRPFWDTSKNQNMMPRKQWEEDYFEKIYPHLKPKAKEWYDKYSTSKKPYWKLKGKDKTNEYHLRPKEMSARASQIRHEIDKMNAGDTAQKKAGSLLERLVSTEGRLVTEEGLDMMVNKLWGVGPVGIGGALGLSFQEGKAKK